MTNIVPFSDAAIQAAVSHKARRAGSDDALAEMHNATDKRFLIHPRAAGGLLTPTAFIEKMFNFSMLCLLPGAGYDIKQHGKAAFFLRMD